jgi:hypothetical protein
MKFRGYNGNSLYYGYCYCYCGSNTNEMEPKFPIAKNIDGYRFLNSARVKLCYRRRPHNSNSEEGKFRISTCPTYPLRSASIVVCRRGISEITTEITCFNKKTWIKLVSINCTSLIRGTVIHSSSTYDPHDP